MTSPVDKRPRLWPLRLLQLSPLIVFAIALAVWLTMTPGLRETALRLSSPWNSNPDPAVSDQPLELGALNALDSEMQQLKQTPGADSIDAVRELTIAADGTTSRVMAKSWRLYDSSGTLQPYSIPADDDAFLSLIDAEKTPGVRIGAFAIPPRTNPPVALAAVASLNGLSAADRREYETSGTLEGVRRVIRQGEFGGTPPGWFPGDPADSPLPVDVQNLNGGELTAYEKGRSVHYSAASVGNHVYELYSIYSFTGPGDLQMGPPMLADRTALDTDANRRSLQRLAEQTGGAVFVVGPTDDGLVPIRPPKGMSQSATTELARAVAATMTLSMASGVTRTEPAVAALPGAGPWTANVAAYSPGLWTTSPAGKLGPLAPMVYVAFWDEHPDIALLWTRIGRTPERVLRVWIATNSPYILGALVMLFLASLVASPVAFARERTLTAELELDRERERVRREARERVLNRLTELSARIDEAATVTPTNAAGEIALAARDIDSTIDELRLILGDLSAREGGRDV